MRKYQYLKLILFSSNFNKTYIINTAQYFTFESTTTQHLLKRHKHKLFKEQKSTPQLKAQVAKFNVNSTLQYLNQFWASEWWNYDLKKL